METTSRTNITVEVLVNAPIEKVWETWTMPEHIVQWNNASEDWLTPLAENDLKKDGKFKYTMAARDGSLQFDFEGIYTNIEQNKTIQYIMADGREVKIIFTPFNNQTKVEETFDPENQNSLELQKAGWQAILNKFKKHTEAL